MTAPSVPVAPPVCQQCGASPPLRGGTVCGACHPLSPGDAYRRSLCCDCRCQPYSAGRPRCAECHTDYLVTLTTGPYRATPAQLGGPPEPRSAA